MRLIAFFNILSIENSVAIVKNSKISAHIEQNLQHALKVQSIQP